MDLGLKWYITEQSKAHMTWYPALDILISIVLHKYLNIILFQDFELNELLNRHFKVCMTIVDENELHPELKKDIFWNQSEPEFIEQPDVHDADKLGPMEDFVFQWSRDKRGGRLEYLTITVVNSQSDIAIHMYL